MRYEMMLPHHIKTAIDEDWPVVLPLGPLEYHGQHMSVGMDTLCVVRTAERLRQRGRHLRATQVLAGDADRPADVLLAALEDAVRAATDILGRDDDRPPPEALRTNRQQGCRRLLRQLFFAASDCLL